MDITIIGGGFAGVKTALELAEQPDNHITLISDKADFQYYPALYGTATGHSHLESWVPLGKIFAGKTNVKLVLDTIETIDPDRKTVTGTSGTSYTYKTCVLALGAVTTYYGIKGMDTHAYGIKSEQEIKKLKSHLYDDIINNHKVDKHYVVVGGGAAGVELSSALGSYIKRLCRHYNVKCDNVRVDLIEAAPRLLPRMHEDSGQAALRRLQKLGVNVQTGKSVESASADSIIVSGQPISSHTIIWTAGVANHPFYKNNSQHFTVAKNGRVVVDEYLRTSNSNVYVLGDNAATPHAGLAQTALHDALFVADNLQRQAARQPLKKYQPIKPPVVVPIGESWAIFEWHNIRIYGWLASLIRHLADIMNYSDMLPLGQALGVWHAQTVIEDYPDQTQVKNSR